jgi:ankyrin repeat protein
MKKSKKYYFFSVIVMCVSLIICVSAANATVDGISEADTPISDASMVLTSIDPINVDQGYENGDVSNNYAKLFNETSINLKRVNGCAPLHYAAYFNHLDLLKGILKGNPDINALSNDGFTPLFIASEYGYVDNTLYSE